MENETILVKLDFIIEQVAEIKVFVNNFDDIFNRKYEEKRQACPGYQWCDTGIEEFKVIQKDFNAHIEYHKIMDNVNNKVISNRKWIVGLLATTIIGWIIYYLKQFFHHK